VVHLGAGKSHDPGVDFRVTRRVSHDYKNLYQSKS
jgi:hypothetical protein